jgi:hypothetical protein
VRIAVRPPVFFLEQNMSTVVEEETMNLETEQDVDVVVDGLEEEGAVEKRRLETVKAVEKILGGKDEKQSADKTKHSDAVDDSRVEDDSETPDDLTQALKDRASAAGVSEALALRLHQSGLLDESLAAMDRNTIERATKTPKREPKETPKAKAEPEIPERDGVEDSIPSLDPDQFDDALVKRDAFFQKRIADLESRIAAMSQTTESVAKQRDNQFQQWFAKEVDGLKNAELFGGEGFAQDGPHHKNRQSLCDGYERICIACGIDPYDCSPDMLRRAYPAMFPDEVFKAAQRDTVRRLRDAEGKFIKPTRSSGGLPSSTKRKTQEELDADLLAKVNGILKKSYK